MKKEDWIEGLKAVLPVSISYIPIGVACGIVMQQSGFGTIAVLLMSLLIYGGASQFMIASMAVSGAGLIQILFMVFFINLRHLLMSSSLANRVKDESTLFHFVYAQTITDESFGINTIHFRNNPNWTPHKALAAGIIPYSAWVISTFIGAIAGNTLQVSTLVMNYLLTAMFIYLLVTQLENRIVLWTAVCAIVLAVIFMILLKSTISILIASVLASLFGLYLELLREKKKGGVYES